MPMVDMVKTGKNIRELREAKGHSVRDVQEAFGLSTANAVYKWQKGESLPTVDNLLGLSRLFGVTVEELIVTT